MLKVFLICLALVALCVIGLCFNIIFRKNGEFPQTEIEHNVEMKKKGIRCAREEEKKLCGKNRKKGDLSCDDASCGDCGACMDVKKELGIENPEKN